MKMSNKAILFLLIACLAVSVSAQTSEQRSESDTAAKRSMPPAKSPNSTLDSSSADQSQQSEDGATKPEQSATKQEQEQTESNRPRVRTEPTDLDGIERTPKLPVPEPAVANKKRSEFSIFVQSSLGYQLPQFGSELFTRVPSTYATATRLSVPADYVIGPGDQLDIRSWGTLDMNVSPVVNRSGEIFLAKVGAVRVAGLKFDQVTPFLKSAIGRYFQNFDLSVNLGSIRSIQVLVAGQANRPGTYTVSALSTLLNALFVSGGPSQQGSMRHIQLKRGSAVVTEFDLYDVLARGDTSKDAVLQSGDVIFIPASGPQVALAGSVAKAAIYELKSATENFSDLLQEAGGISNVASLERIQVERIKDRTSRTVQEFGFDEIAKSEIRDGDIIFVRRMSTEYSNSVVVRGNVAIPGRYPWHEGITVHDLIPTKEVLISEHYWESLASEGQVENATVTRKLVHLSDINWGYAVIERLAPNDLKAQLITFNLERAIAGEGSDNKTLLPNDIVTIYTQAEMPVPVSHRTRFVTVVGEVNSAGTYSVAPGETLRSVIERAGGFTQDAFIYGSEFTRESAKVQQQRQFDRLLAEMETRPIRQRSSNTAGDSQAERNAAVDERQRTISRLRLIRPNGRVVLHVNPSDDKVADVPDLSLEDGDRLVIPPRPDFVTVVGATNQNGSFTYVKGLRTGDLIREAGGLNSDADKGHSFVIRASGAVVASGSGLFAGGLEKVETLPGDTIIVVSKDRGRYWIDNLKDWSTIIGNIGLAAAAINVLK
jgi:polysaccharide biosynthesis/export protein